MQEDNLPKDRMIFVEDLDPENSVLINVDELESVKRFDQRPQLYMGSGPQPYNRGLKFVFTSGESHLVETKMTLREFEIERAKKFTPVTPEKTEAEMLEGSDWGESGWNVDDIKTQWFYWYKGGCEWVGTRDMSEAIEQSKGRKSKHKAVMYRQISKEWDAYGD